MTTGTKALTELLVDSDKHIGASENTCFTVDASGSEEAGKVTINLEYGKALFTIDNKLPDDSKFEVSTPNTLLSVRGTTFEVTYDVENEKTVVKVIEGTVVGINGTEIFDEYERQIQWISADGISENTIYSNEQFDEYGNVISGQYTYYFGDSDYWFMFEYNFECEYTQAKDMKFYDTEKYVY